MRLISSSSFFSSTSPSIFSPSFPSTFPPIFPSSIQTTFPLLNIFYSCFPPVWQLALYISPSFSPFLRRPFLIPCHYFLLYRQSYPPWECETAAILSYAVSHLHEGTGKLRKTCTDTVGHLTESVPSLTQSLKNDLPLSVSMRRSRTGGHPSKYWPSEKLLDLGDRLAPDTYHTPNTAGHFSIIIFHQYSIN